MNRQVYSQITERIVALLEAGTVPWHKPWKAQTALPRNLVTKKPYRGVNVFLLMASGYESPYWLTFRQAAARGGRIRKGEKGCAILFWNQKKILEEESGEEIKVQLLRLYTVFNLAQCEELGDVSKETNEEPILINKPAEIVAKMPQKPRIKHGMTESFYSPREDCVSLPVRKRFGREEEYYSTLFHELVHSTGHESRLNRQTLTVKAGFGSDPYCKEELIAEIGAAFICAQSEILERTINNSAAYIKSWLDRLKSDHTLIVQAAAQAQRAADFVLGLKAIEGRPAEQEGEAHPEPGEAEA